MEANDLLYQIALTKIKNVGDVTARTLLAYFGSGQEVLKARSHTFEKVPGIGEIIAKQIECSKMEALKRAEKEMTFVAKNNIKVFSIMESDYPRRLRECQDAPIVFYYKGNTNLDAEKVVSIVGTRRASDYGKHLIEDFINDSAQMFPHLLVISGLAYGIDVCAHRNALKHGMPTVGVLAHGLDRIYPSANRNTAEEMLKNGGLLTDFMSETNPDRENFLQRNRLIAGLADATIVVESAEKGGALVTADIAFSYGRDVYAFPGRTDDEFSMGCNRLIQTNKAGMITSAQDFVMAQCWDIEAPTKTEGLQPQLAFREHSDHPIVKTLAEKGELQINELAMEMRMPVHQLSAMLFELELAGCIKVLPGGVYQLI